MNDYILICEKELDRISQGTFHCFHCEELNLKFYPESSLTAVQAKLEKVIKTLTQIRDDLIPGDLYEGHTPYAEMFWTAQKLAKETLKELEAEK